MVVPLLLVNELVVAIASEVVLPPLGVTVPVHVGLAAPVHTATAALAQLPPVKMIVAASAEIAVVVVAFRTICEGVRLIDVSSTSPSIDVIAVTESYVAALLVVMSALETPVTEVVVIVPG